MKKPLKFLFYSLFLLNLNSFAAQNKEITEKLSPEIAERLVNAIYRIENSKKYPYGIKSIPIKGNTQPEREAYARRICLNTVNNNFKRFQQQGSKGDFFEFLAEKFCPTKGNSLSSSEKRYNKYWLPNLRKILGCNSYEDFRNREKDLFRVQK
ncbi:MAG: hypothetical protein AABY22_05780 [Nanoarchaeota archaeon]